MELMKQSKREELGTKDSSIHLQEKGYLSVYTEDSGVQGQVGLGFEQPCLVEDVPACGKGVELGGVFLNSR